MRVGVIETPSQPWEGRIIPLDHTRNYLKILINQDQAELLSSPVVVAAV